MVTPRSFLSCFPILDSVTAEKVARWLDHPKDLKILENELGNRMLYPEIVAVSHDDFLLDLAILREAVALSPLLFYNPNLKRVKIPELFTLYFPNLSQLVLAFIDALQLKDLVSFFVDLEKDGNKPLGTLVKPKIFSLTQPISLEIDGKSFEIRANDLTTIPAFDEKVDLKFRSEGSTLLGRQELVAQVTGGVLGILVDLRK